MRPICREDQGFVQRVASCAITQASQAHVTSKECKFTFSQGDLPLMYSCVFWCEFIYVVGFFWLYRSCYESSDTGHTVTAKKRLNR